MPLFGDTELPQNYRSRFQKRIQGFFKDLALPGKSAFWPFLRRLANILHLLRHISFKRFAFETQGTTQKCTPSTWLLKCKEWRSLAYVLLLTCLLNLLVPCTAANSKGHYVVGVVAMGWRKYLSILLYWTLFPTFLRAQTTVSYAQLVHSITGTFDTDNIHIHRSSGSRDTNVLLIWLASVYIC